MLYDLLGGMLVIFAETANIATSDREQSLFFAT